MPADIIPIRNPNIPDFPEVFDSTIRASFANCFRKGYWEFIRKKRKPGGNIHQLFGGCFAKAMEVCRKSFYIRGLSQDDAITEGLLVATEMWETAEGDNLVPGGKSSGANKTYAALVDAIDSYFTRWSMEDDAIVPLRLPNGELFIEKTFAFPVEGTRHPVTGNPIAYSGRLDMLGEWKDTGLYVGIDEKTSGYLGESWAANWPMRGQLSGYCYGSSVFGYKIRHFHIRGIGILKTDITFAENLQSRDEWQIDAWLIQIRRDINRATAAWIEMYREQQANGFDGRGMEKHWDQNFDSVCSSYNGCPYMDLCTSENPDRWLRGNYIDVDWEPLRERE
jgi:hypothetical protein